MKNHFTGYLLVLFLGATAASIGCSTAPAGGSGGKTGTGVGSGGSTGQGSGGSTSSGAGVLLMPSPSGFVAADTNTLGATGAWYAYGDGYGDGGVVGGKCQMAGHTTCSVITAPALPSGTAGFPPSAAGAMCTTGMVAAVANITGMATPDYSNIFGSGIGLDLNNPGGANGKGVFNASMKGVTGISFTLDAPPLAGLRVEFAATDTDGTTAGADYWGAGPSYPNSPVVAGTNTINFMADVKGPGPAPAHTFDPSKLESIQFHVPTTTTAGASYSFCISNLKLLM